MGIGTGKDYSAAHRWYGASVAQNCAGAQANLGYLYLYGKGVRRDRSTAMMWFRKASANGDLDAQRELSRP